MADGVEALVLIDLQRDYFVDDELERCRADLVATSNRLVAAAVEAHLPVIEVRTVHDPCGSTWTLTMREDGKGVVLAGSPGAEPVVGLDAQGAPVVIKTRDSAFFDTDLLQLLRRAHADQVVLCGVSTESCILATAIDAFAHDLRVTLVSDATASIDWDLHDRTLARLRAQYRQEVTDSETVIGRWRSG